MSENDEENQEVHAYGNRAAKENLSLSVSVDRNAEIDALQKENAELRLATEKLAEQKFAAKKEQLRQAGYDVRNLEMTEEGIQSLKELDKDRIRKSSGGGGAPLNNQQLGSQDEENCFPPDVDIDFWTSRSPEELITAIDEASKNSQHPQQKQARQYISQLIKKSHKKGGVYQLEGNLTELGKKNPDPKKMPHFERIKEEE